MVRFYFASAYGAFRLAKLRESCFVFKNHVVLAVLIFHVQKIYLIEFAKTCPICGKTDSQVYALIELSWWVNTL